MASLAFFACQPGIIGGDAQDFDENQAKEKEEINVVSPSASVIGGSGGNGASAAGGSAGQSSLGGSAGSAAGGAPVGQGGRGGAGGISAMGGSGGGGGSGEPPPISLKPTIMAVGYGGMRVVSQNGGISWKKVAQLSRDGGDDRELLRSVAYGNGRWISAGWRMFTSRDGSTWVEGKNPEGCGIMEGAAFGNGVFVGTCGEDAFTSQDGLTWVRAGAVGDTLGHTYVLFANGKFAASGDNGASFQSMDGKSWTRMSGINKVRLCDGQFRSEADCPSEAWFPNQHLRGAWKGGIERSPTGAQWTRTYNDDWDNTVYRFGEGLMPALAQ